MLFMQPYCRIKNMLHAGIAQRQTASLYFRQLVKIGILEAVNFGRLKLYINPLLLRGLNDL
ncbi:hypothetical protein [Candidatus Williamhamiltonella defendens]|uniref:hypothetical protein n=1 Tax=Candidatus Williamhamiltonella defendens TaxID=138072 RepID=UPI00387E3906